MRGLAPLLLCYCANRNADAHHHTASPLLGCGLFRRARAGLLRACAGLSSAIPLRLSARRCNSFAAPVTAAQRLFFSLLRNGDCAIRCRIPAYLCDPRPVPIVCLLRRGESELCLRLLCPGLSLLLLSVPRRRGRGAFLCSCSALVCVAFTMQGRRGSAVALLCFPRHCFLCPGSSALFRAVALLICPLPLPCRLVLRFSQAGRHIRSFAVAMVCTNSDALSQPTKAFPLRIFSTLSTGSHFRSVSMPVNHCGSNALHSLCRVRPFASSRGHAFAGRHCADPDCAIAEGGGEEVPSPIKPDQAYLFSSPCLSVQKWSSSQTKRPLPEFRHWPRPRSLP